MYLFAVKHKRELKMKEHHLQLAKYWKQTANSFGAAGLHHMSALFQRYSDEHAVKANNYEE